MIAPPQVQAHNLANAIRTDIGSTLILVYPWAAAGLWPDAVEELPVRNNAKQTVNRKSVNPDSAFQV
ncbi:hypothetical protein [Sphingobium sp. AP50]|uniref:hypothetical protein n=1 Tax=Sphingobium sp. AP50 TaxID=1884369 RepID=UPI0011601873|nr:hypothetical protein [Sphingobium sp. AP50]